MTIDKLTKKQIDHAWKVADIEYCKNKNHLHDSDTHRLFWLFVDNKLKYFTEGNMWASFLYHQFKNVVLDEKKRCARLKRRELGYRDDPTVSQIIFEFDEDSNVVDWDVSPDSIDRFPKEFYFDEDSRADIGRAPYCVAAELRRKDLNVRKVDWITARAKELGADLDVLQDLVNARERSRILKKVGK